MAEKKRILIVDDNKVVRALFKAIGNGIGVETVAVSNAQDAKAKLKEGTSFALILIDLIMPHESGWSLLDEIKCNPDTANVPVIITTGAILSPQEMDKLLQKSCAVVQKGTFNLDQFKKLLNNVL